MSDHRVGTWGRGRAFSQRGPAAGSSTRVSTGSAYQKIIPTVYFGIPSVGVIANYGVTAGFGMSCYIGETLANAHGVGGNQRGVGGCEGIPYDAPQ